MDPLLRHRSNQLELMDQPHLVTKEEMVGSLDGLRRVNRLLGGVSPTISGVLRLLKNRKPANGRFFRICDVGTGAADIPIALLDAARKHRIPLHVSAVESNPDLAAAARKAAHSKEYMTIICGDARDLLASAARGGGSAKTRDHHPSGEIHEELAPNRPFDVVTASLFLHHFPPTEVVAWLRLMAGAAKLGVVVNDLERHPLAWMGIKVAGPVLCRNRVFLHDAPLSVRRAYNVAEWKAMAREAGWKRLNLQRRWAWRVILTGK